MPEISRFLGIIVFIYYNEHGVPHFHVRYGEEVAVFSIEKLELLEGSLSKRALSLVLEWAFEHRVELLENWQLAQNNKPLKKIDPLN